MKYQKKALLLMLVSTLTVAGVVAQNNPFNLKACINYALENHPTSSIYQNEVKISRQKTLEYISPYLPQVNAAYTFDDNIIRQTSVIPAGTFGNPDDLKVQFGLQYNNNMFVQLDQAIFDQTMMYAAPGIKNTNKAADLNVLKNNETLIYNTAIAYYKVLISKEQESLLQQNHKKFDDLLKVLQLQYDKGALKKIDLDRVKVSTNNISSQLNVIHTNYELALNTLKNAIGMQMNEALLIQDSVQYNMDVQMPETTTVNFNNRLDYQILNTNIALQTVDMRRKKTAFLPSLSFYARYGGQSFNNDFVKSFDNWFDYGSIGFKLNVPLFSGLRRHSQYMQSKFTLDNAKENLKITENQIQLQQQNAQTQLFSSYTNFSTNKLNLDLAKEVFDNTTLQYQLGAATLSDLLNADYSYKEAQSNYITSMLNFLLARLDYEKAQGTLNTYINTLK